jgi:hypothetical protein
MIDDASTPIIVARTTTSHRILTSGSAARSTACQETARRSIERPFSASAATSHHGCTLLSDLPIPASPTPDSARTINAASATEARASTTRPAEGERRRRSIRVIIR